MKRDRKMLRKKIQRILLTQKPLLERKKRLSRQMAKQYNPSLVEKSWYTWWERSGFFVTDTNSSKPPFTIEMIICWRRMSGYNTLWVLGMDQSGIATQVVVEKKLMRERELTRHDLGCENFFSEVSKWKDEYGGTILKQERCLGASFDWSCECFTMDDKRSKAVTEAFVSLYREGLIRRRKTIY